MKGFFSNKETQSKSRPTGKTISCASCGLYKDCKSPRMQAYGNFSKRVMVIGEAPGKVEDMRGKPWQGKTGQLLQRVLRGMGVDLFEDCVSLNAVNCRPVDNRTPTNHEIDCCRRRVLKAIDEYSPDVIILLGGSAVTSLIGHRWQRDLGGISKWRGWTIPDQDFMAWVCPTFHSSFVERGEKEVMTVWKQDLTQAIDKLNDHLPRYRKPKIEFIDDLSTLEHLGSSLVAIDYETTGLKPHAPGHRIVCAAVADTPNHAYSFLMPATKRGRQPFLNLLERSKGKIAHNMKYEQTWSVVKLRQKVVFWEWDTMLAAHLLDNRPGVTSLKFQTYTLLGVVDYESEVSNYLKAKTKGGNEINQIHKLLGTQRGKEQLLYYCGLDVINTYRVARIQIDEIGYSFLPF